MFVRGLKLLPGHSVWSFLTFLLYIIPLTFKEPSQEHREQHLAWDVYEVIPLYASVETGSLSVTKCLAAKTWKHMGINSNMLSANTEQYINYYVKKGHRYLRTYILHSI